MELAKSDLDMPKEIAPEQIARDGNGADRGIEGETPEVWMREGKTMNPRGDSERSSRIQSDFAPRHQVDSQDRHHERTVEERKLSAGIKMRPHVCGYAGISG